MQQRRPHQHVSHCARAAARGIAAPRQGWWQLSREGCSNSLAVASPPGTVIGRNMDQHGRKTLWGARGGTAMGREHLSGQMAARSSDTQSATVCSSQRRSEVLSMAALGHLCLGTGLCDTSYSPGTQEPSCYLLVVHFMEECNSLGLQLLQQRDGVVQRGHPSLEL